MTYDNFNESTAAAHAVASAKSGHRVRLVGGVLVAADAVTVTIEDSDGTDLVGPCALGANGVLQVPEVETDDDKGLSVLLGGAVQVGGSLNWEYVTSDS